MKVVDVTLGFAYVDLIADNGLLNKDGALEADMTSAACTAGRFLCFFLVFSFHTSNAFRN